MHREIGLRQQRGQLESFEAVAGDFGVAVEARLAIHGFVAAIEVVEKVLCAGFGDGCAFGAADDRLGGVRAD